MRLISVLSCLALLFGAAEGKIIECPRFEELINHVDSDTLVLLDIDDTLLVPAQMLGSDEWFMHRWRLHQEKGMESRAALDQALAEWEGVRHLTKMEIVEEGSEEIVRQLQEHGYKVMGLTTQGMVLNTRTTHQLLEQGIDLRKAPPTHENVYFQLDGQGVLFRNGILSTSGRNKGKALFQFCDAIGMNPDRIVFINDKETHLAEIEKAAIERGVEFMGLRYSYSDNRKAAFCAELADYQFHNSSFHQILSDSESLVQLSSSLKTGG